MFLTTLPILMSIKLSEFLQLPSTTQHLQRKTPLVELSSVNPGQWGVLHMASNRIRRPSQGGFCFRFEGMHVSTSRRRPTQATAMYAREASHLLSAAAVSQYIASGSFRTSPAGGGIDVVMPSDPAPPVAAEPSPPHRPVPARHIIAPPPPTEPGTMR